MVYPVTVYHKSGKTRKSVSTQKLNKKYWEDFQLREKTPKKFVKEKIQAGTHKLLREYQHMNSMLDAILFSPMKHYE